MRIGIDVGGTNTDAVLMDGDRVLAEVKSPTSADVTTGILDGLRSLLAQSGIAAEAVETVMIGTTHFTNADVEARRLLEVASVRLGLPATRALPPMVDWPERLGDAVGRHVYLCHGGHEFDGREIAPLDADELKRVADEIAAKGLRAVAISSAFSPINDDLERRAEEIIRETVPDVASAGPPSSAGWGCSSARTRRS
jgi:N-methylhydantoinase A/oxoprolinase/acetone carboxylase beta subunit